jgi:hypothetical protein
MCYSTGMSVQDGAGSGTIGKRLQGHPLKSFSVPAPPPQSAPSTPQQKHVGEYMGHHTTLFPPCPDVTPKSACSK